VQKELIPIEIIENKIFVIRGQKVMLDSDLALLYGVETKNLNKAVKRNISRFPSDFMFELTTEEWANLKFQIGTSSWGGRRKLPSAFTEHGVIMLSSVLNSERAVQVNIQIMRTFNKLRAIISNNKEIIERLDILEQNFIAYTKDTNIELIDQETKINEISKYLKYLIDIHKPGKIGFRTND
jgi:hypothetical protein